MREKFRGKVTKRLLIHCGCAALLLLTEWAGAAGEVSAGQTDHGLRLADLRHQLAAQVAAPRFEGALWGVSIISLDTGWKIFESHPERLMSPASNSKLYVGALALSRLGGDYQIHTPVGATAKPDTNGVLVGDLIVSGRGDPSWLLTSEDAPWDNLFGPFVKVVADAGVRRIQGDLVADTTFFRSPCTGSGWTVDDLDDAEGGRISALTLQDNTSDILVRPGDRVGWPGVCSVTDPDTGIELDNLTVTVETNRETELVFHREPGGRVAHVFGRIPRGGQPTVMDIPVPDPAAWFANGLRTALRHHGIEVTGGVRVVGWPAVTPAMPVRLGEVTSPPLRELVRHFMKPSQNLEADLIFEHTGELTREAQTPAWRTSEELAVRALEEFLHANHLPAALYFDEGSGLSRNNLTTAETTVGLLREMATGPEAADFTNSLPIAGVDGTLRRRMRGTPAAGNVRAKTGTLRWSNDLSGYVTTVAGEHLAFSMMLNRYVSPSGRGAREELDAMAVALARLSERSKAAP